MSRFHISDDNPNDVVGGGGTLTTGETKDEDACGPFVIFPATETASNSSPHAVLTYADVVEIYDALTSPEDQPQEIDLPEADVVEVDEDAVPVI